MEIDPDAIEIRLFTPDDDVRALHTAAANDGYPLA